MREEPPSSGTERRSSADNKRKQFLCCFLRQSNSWSSGNNNSDVANSFSKLDDRRRRNQRNKRAKDVLNCSVLPVIIVDNRMGLPKLIINNIIKRLSLINLVTHFVYHLISSAPMSCRSTRLFIDLTKYQINFLIYEATRKHGVESREDLLMPRSRRRIHTSM